MKIEIPTAFVKANENIKAGDVVKLKSEGEYKDIKTSDDKTKQVLQFDLELPGGEIKTYSMNVTTQKNLISAYGDDSKKWIDKELKAWIEKQLSFGKRINVLILTPKDLTPKEWTQPTDESPENDEIPIIE